MSLTVFLADDHAVVRDGLKLWLETQADFPAVGEATDGREALTPGNQSPQSGRIDRV